MSLATPSTLGAGDYSWRFSLGGTGVPIANWAAMGVPVSGGFGAALTDASKAGGAPKGVFDSGDDGRGGLGGRGLSGAENTASQKGAQTSVQNGGYSEPTFETGRTIRNIGRLGGMVMPGLVGALAGTAIGAVGTLSDVEEANAALASLGLPDKVGAWEALGASNLHGAFGLQSAQEQYNGIVSNAWDLDMANAADMFGPSPGWDTDMANAAQNFDSLASEVGSAGLDGWDDSSSGDLSGPSSGDIDDEAPGESDMGQDDY